MKYTVELLQPKLDAFLKPVLAKAGLSLRYEMGRPENPHPEVENPEVTVWFRGDDVDLLLANRAELLLSLEHLSMEALRMPAEDHSLLSFDANDYRLLRLEELRMSALAAAEKVKRSRVPFHFSPMSSRERRVIHLALRNETDLRSESVGAGPARAVVVVPADMPTPPAPPYLPRGPQRSGPGFGGPRDGGARGGGGPYRGGNPRSPRGRGR